MQAVLSYAIAAVSLLLGLNMVLNERWEAAGLFWIAGGIFTVAAALESKTQADS